MCNKGDHYKYVGVYLDDLAFAMKEPQAFAAYLDNLAFAMKEPEAFVKMLENKYSSKLKGTGKLSFHLGCDFYRDEDGIICMAPTKYIERMADNYARICRERPKLTIMSPLEKGDHPELDDTLLLDAEGIQNYQSLRGSAQWAISLGRLGIQTAIMTLSSFRSAPCVGHLERAKRMFNTL
jgi:hypothetical protein